MTSKRYWGWWDKTYHQKSKPYIFCGPN